MGRVFTISFEYLKERHNAIVSICGEDLEAATIKVKFPNEDLHLLIPGGYISFKYTDSDLPAQVQNKWAVELFNTIKKAVYQHLHHHTTA